MANFDQENLQDVTSKASCVVLATLLKKRLSEFPDCRLPSFRELAAEYNVSLGVVQRAMRTLKQESLVQIRRNVGSRVVDQPMEPEFVCYGLIEPFPINHGQTLVTTSHLLQIADEMNINAVPLVRNSSQQSQIEREVAQKLLKNPFLDGILLSPCSGKENADFFNELAKEKPIVCIDNELESSNLPAVIFDYERAGREIADEFLKLGCKKMMLLLERDFENASIADLKRTISEKMEVAIYPIPFNMVHQDKVDFNLDSFFRLQIQIQQFILDSGCDCAFSPFDSILDFVFSLDPVIRLVQNWPLAVITSDLPTSYSANIVSHGMMIWRFSDYSLLKCAFSRMMNWKRKKSSSQDITKIPLDRIR